MLTREFVERAAGCAGFDVPSDEAQRFIRALLAQDDAARVAVETWDEIGQEGEPYVERLRATLLPLAERAL